MVISRKARHCFLMTTAVFFASLDCRPGNNLSAASSQKASGNSYFVSATDPKASDGNDGSQERPLRSISRAAQLVKPGDTVWIHGGVYRETVLVNASGESFDRMISFRAVPGEKVIVKGSEVITGWTRSASEPNRAIWEADWRWEGIYPSMICVDDTPMMPLSVPAATEELKPPKAYCQYFIGFGRGQTAMFPGSFYYDEARRKLLVWLPGDEDPRQHTMEGAVRACWDSRGSYLLVEGITFKCAPLVVPVGGIVFVMTGTGGGMASADGCIVRDCDISLGAFEGMYVRGGKEVTTLIEDCWIHHNGNGCGGFEGHGLPNTKSWLTVRRCRITDNNLFNWNSSWHCGGKHFGTRVFFDECEFARNYRAPGVWFDCHTRDCIVNRCYSHDNGSMQLYYEIGETGAFINNVAEGVSNCCAVAFNGASRSLLAHNAIVAPERGIIVGWEGNVEGQVSRVTCHNSVFNNLLLGRDFPLLTMSAEKDIGRRNVSDNNLFWRTNNPNSPTGTWKILEDDYTTNTPVDIGTWRATRKLDIASRVAEPKIELKHRHFSRLPGSACLSGGKRLTKDVLRDLFGVKPMPTLTAETISSSIRDHLPASEAFVEKVAELLYVPQNKEVPIGPVAIPGHSSRRRLTLNNPSFESPALSVNGVSPAIPGWVESESSPEGATLWHANGTPLWNWYPPDGDNVLVLTGNIKEGSEVGVSQVLKDTLQPNLRYELRVWAGQRMDNAAFLWPKVTMALYAGPNLLKSVEVPQPKIAPHVGVWVENLLTYVSPSKVLPGQKLKVLISRSGSSASQACFDDVELEATPLS